MVAAMKRVIPFAMLVALAGCGGAKKDAAEPSHADETAPSDGGGIADPAAAGSSTPTSSTPAPGDDAVKKAVPCGGADIADLASVLSQAACEVASTNPGEHKDVSDQLEIKVAPDSPRVAPGSTATVTVTFRNKGKGELPLNFVVDPEPRFDFEVYTLKGSRVDAPHGKAPALPPEVANAEVPEPKIARVTLASQGTARLVLKWDAVKYKWASKERAKGALPGRGYPKEKAGPIPKGTYTLRVVTPLTNVAEGGDHEVSQPRVQITVAPTP